MEEKVTVRTGEIVASTVGPLFVRADHRIIDAYSLGKFLATLRRLLEDPTSMESCGNAASDNDGKNGSKTA